MNADVVELTETAPKTAYFDNNATTRPLPEVVEAMVDMLGNGFGNASSAHSGGEAARQALARARQSVADLLGVGSDHIVFTSGGTEANNMVLLSGLKAGQTIITSTIEHSSIVKMASHLEQQGVSIFRLKPNRSGYVSANSVKEAIEKAKPSLVSIQWVNSETGVIQPVEEIAKSCADANVLFHTDAAQAVGKLSVNVTNLGADFVTCTAHKFHGPAGIGMVYAKDPTSLKRVLFGGDQEHGLRAGTENLAGIVGAGVAAEHRNKNLKDVISKLKTIRDRFESALQSKFPWIEANGDADRRVCNTSNLHFRGLDGQALVAQFDAINIQCSQSSACTNLRPEPSYVLREMGLSEDEAYASIRFSFGELNSLKEIAAATDRMAPIIQKLREILH